MSNFQLSRGEIKLHFDDDYDDDDQDDDGVRFA